jgi:hypothetical protein
MSIKISPLTENRNKKERKKNEKEKKSKKWEKKWEKKRKKWGVFFLTTWLRYKLGERYFFNEHCSDTLRSFHASREFTKIFAFFLLFFVFFPLHVVTT